MIDLTQRKTDPIPLAIVLALVLAAVVLSVAYPAMLPWSFLALAGGAFLLYWSVRWEVTLLAWVWVFSYGLLDWPQWRLETTSFFNMTVPRFIFLAVVLAFALHFMFRKGRIRYDGAVLWVMLALVVYCAASAAKAGWTQAMDPPARGAPYFRLLGPLLFPFIMFFCVYNATRDQKQIRRVLILLSVYGWYALYIGYLQYAAIRGVEGARSLIWPAYINDPNFGHHFDRARGAFNAANPQANLLILLFYANLFLIRRIRGPYRAALIIQAILIPLAIFFTGLRAAYVGFALCGIVWCLWGCKGRLGKTKLALASLAVAIGVVMFWGSLAQTRPAVPRPVEARRLPIGRAMGGVAQMDPIRSRLVLFYRAGDMVAQHPLTGVGFGHFMEADKAIERDPASFGAAWGAVTPISTPANLFAVMVAETGIIGLGLLVAVFVLIYRQSLRLYRGLQPQYVARGFKGDTLRLDVSAGMPGGMVSDRPSLLSRDFVVVFWVAMVVYLTDATFVDPLWDVPSNGLFWAFAGLVVGYNRLVKNRALPVSDAPASEG